MATKKPRLTKLDASVLEAQMRRGTESSIVLVEAIAEAHQTTVRCVIERQSGCRTAVQYKPEFNINF